MKTRFKLIAWLAFLFMLTGLALVANTYVSPNQPSQSTAMVQTTQTSAKPAERVIRIDALYFSVEATATGGTSAVQIRVRPSAQPGQLRVGFYEEEVGGTAQQWRASGWVAVLLGSILSGVDPADYEFSFSVGGRIDGPSAGGLMTVGILAGLRGDRPREDATMTGIINPDGTIGPVGGIPHKIEGAARKGKKLVLVPVGQRYSFDYNKEQPVDVIEVGRKLGVQVREVNNIYEAYEQIVGKPLPRPQASARAPELPPRAFDRLKAKTEEWSSRYEKERRQFESFPKQIKTSLVGVVEAADEAARKADKNLSQGLGAVAFFKAVEAAGNMRLANTAGTMIRHYNSGGLKSVMSHVQLTQAMRSEISAMVGQLQTQRLKTVSDVLAIFDAYSSLGIAEGLALLADSKLSELAEHANQYSKEELLLHLVNIAGNYALASDCVQLAQDAVDIEMGFGVTPAPKPEKVLRVAEMLRRASEANLALFEATTINELAEQHDASPNLIKALLLMVDKEFLLASASSVGMMQLIEQVGEGPKSAAVIFGNSQNVYAFSSSLVAKYYSLGAEVDDDLNVTSFENEKALGVMLDFAEQRAKELINLCGDDVPVPAIIYYENARSASRGNAQDQLTALNYYWQATVLAQAGAFLAGKMLPTK